MNAMSPVDRITLPDWPRLMRDELAAAYLGLGVSTLWERGPKPKHVGRRALWDRRDLDRWADAIGGQPLDPGQREEEAKEILERVRERVNGRG